MCVSWTTSDLSAYEARRLPAPARSAGKVETREADLHDQILAECRRRGWLVIHSRMDKPSTVQIGSPDFVVAADRGRTFYIEAKARTGKLRPEQRAWLAWASRLGHRAAVVRTLPEFIELISCG